MRFIAVTPPGRTENALVIHLDHIATIEEGKGTTVITLRDGRTVETKDDFSKIWDWLEQFQLISRDDDMPYNRS